MTDQVQFSGSMLAIYAQVLILVALLVYEVRKAWKDHAEERQAKDTVQRIKQP